MSDIHSYDLTVTWTGDRGRGTATYNSFGRDHLVEADGHEPILGSSDQAFRGDASRWNPEEMLLASLSQCHMLWYLHLAADAEVVVTGYVDRPYGVMSTAADGSGQFDRVTLRPRVTITADSDVEAALLVHHRVPDFCFIARSVNFPVDHEPEIVVAE